MIAFDQRWHGRGIRSPRFRFVDCADDVAAVMDELGVEQAIIAGYSMGGAIAQLRLAPAPRQGRRPRAVLDGSQLPRARSARSSSSRC